MSEDDTAPEAPETCNSSATPSLRGLLVAGAGIAGGGAAQLLAAMSWPPERRRCSTD